MASLDSTSAEEEASEEEGSLKLALTYENECIIPVALFDASAHAAVPICSLLPIV